MSLLRAAVSLLVVVVATALGFVLYAWRPAIDPIAPPAPNSFDRALVSRGATLAVIGNCHSCHTAPGGASFAGGVPVQTPFGTIYSTNITRDRETGIGAWSLDAFRRAMGEGVDRQGNHLYPAFPYDHFTRVTDSDDEALYAYLMTRSPVAARAPANELPLPLSFRPIIAAWKLLFFRPGPFTPDPAHDEAWNRGAYLAEGLAHCGACHTPRNIFGAEEAGAALSGGEAEGWTAYAINSSSPAPIPWDAQTLAFYLGHGWHALHGVSRGPMADVTANLGAVPEPDVKAIAAYIADQMGPPSSSRLERAKAVQAASARSVQQVRPGSADSLGRPEESKPAADPGAAIYAAACANCHESGRPPPFGGLDFHLSTAVHGPNPVNIINVVLNGLPAPDGETGPIMPGFAGAISDEQLANLLRFLRGNFSAAPPWDDVEKDIRDVKRRRPPGLWPSDGGTDAPAQASARTSSW